MVKSGELIWYRRIYDYMDEILLKTVVVITGFDSVFQYWHSE